MARLTRPSSFLHQSRSELLPLLFWSAAASPWSWSAESARRLSPSPSTRAPRQPLWADPRRRNLPSGGRAFPLGESPVWRGLVIVGPSPRATASRVSTHQREDYR